MGFCPTVKAMNEKQRRFAEHYAANPNATEAARVAGYSDRTARSQGQRLLTNDDIQEYIKELQEENAAERIDYKQISGDPLTNLVTAAIR